jgi:ribosomal-protein-alanine N-acetyltransferase
MLIFLKKPISTIKQITKIVLLQMLNICFSPFPNLETERLILRRPTMADVDESYKYRADPQLMQFIPHRLAHQRSDVVEAIERINMMIDRNEGIHWAITPKGEEDVLMGMIGYVRMNKDHHRGEIGYMLHTPYHGKGVIQEAFLAAVDYGFNEMKLHSIEAIVNCLNTPSKKLLERAGFSKDAYFRDYLHHEGKYMDVNIYSLLAEDWRKDF